MALSPVLRPRPVLRTTLLAVGHIVTTKRYSVDISTIIGALTWP